jgi:hypothetical protein
VNRSFGLAILGFGDLVQSVIQIIRDTLGTGKCH